VVEGVLAEDVFERLDSRASPSGVEVAWA